MIIIFNQNQQTHKLETQFINFIDVSSSSVIRFLSGGKVYTVPPRGVVSISESPSKQSP